MTCATCKSELVVENERVLPCDICLNEAEDDGYARGYDDGQEDAGPEDKAVALMCRVLDAVEDERKPDKFDVMVLKELL